MTALQYFKMKANEITNAKTKAVKDGINTVTYSDCNNKTHTIYYHSGRWNDRPSSIGQYN